MLSVINLVGLQSPLLRIFVVWPLAALETANAFHGLYVLLSEPRAWVKSASLAFPCKPPRELHIAASRGAIIIAAAELQISRTMQSKGK